MAAAAAPQVVMDATSIVQDLVARRAVYRLVDEVDKLTERGFHVVHVITLMLHEHFEDRTKATRLADLNAAGRAAIEPILGKAAMYAGRLPGPDIVGVEWLEGGARRSITTIEPITSDDGSETVIGLRYWVHARDPVPDAVLHAVEQAANMAAAGGGGGGRGRGAGARQAMAAAAAAAAVAAANNDDMEQVPLPAEAEAEAAGLPEPKPEVCDTLHRMMVAERNRVALRVAALTVAQRQAVRGTDRANIGTYLGEYKYLEVQRIEQQLSTIAGWYLPRATSFGTWEPRRWAAMLIDGARARGTFEPAHAFTVLDAFTYYMFDDPAPAARFFDPTAYYNVLPVEEAPDDRSAPTRPQRWMKALRQAYPWMASAGAPSPERYPAPGTLVAVRDRALRPEILVLQPFPYRLGQPLRTADYDCPYKLRELAERPYYRRLLASVMLQRQATLTPMQAVISSIQADRTRIQERRQRRGEAEIADDAMAFGLENDERERAGLDQLEMTIQQIAPIEDARIARADEAALEFVLRERGGMIDDYADLRDKHALDALNRKVGRYIDGRYPGLLHPLSDNVSMPSDQATTSPEEYERSFLLRLRPDETEATLRRMTSEQLAARTREDDAIPLDYRTPGLMFYGDGPEIVAPFADDNELTAKAIAALPRARMWSSTHEQLIKQEFIIALRVLNEAAWHDIDKNFKRETVERDRAIQAHTMFAAKQALNAFWTTHTTSETVIQARTSMLRIQKDGQPQLMVLQPSINDHNAHHAAMSWVLNTTTGPFQMTARVVTGFLAYYYARFSHMFMGTLTDGRPCPNLLYAGNAEAGKSFILNLIKLLSLPGTVHNSSRQTRAAGDVGVSQGFGMHQMHEGQPAMLQGDQAGKSDGDSEAVTQFKNKLTEKVGVLVTMVYDNERQKKVRVAQVIYTFLFGQHAIAINWAKEKVDKPLMSRLIPVEMKAAVDEGEQMPGVAQQQRTASVKWDTPVATLIRSHNLIHLVAFNIGLLVSAGCVQDGVLTDVAEYLTVQVKDRLVRDFNLDPGLFNTRSMQNIVDVARGVMLVRIAKLLLASPAGHAFLTSRALSIFDAETYVWFIFPMLFITVGDVVGALTLMSFMVDSREDRDLIELISSELFLNAQDARHQKSLRVYAGELSGTPSNNEYAQRQLAGIRIQHDRIQRTREAEAAAERDREAAAEREQRRRQAATNGNEDEEDAMDLDADEPPPRQDALLAYVQQGSEGTMPVHGPAPRDIVDDPRYLVIDFKGPQLDTLAVRIADTLYREAGYAMRAVAIAAFLGKLTKVNIKAPYLFRHPETGWLHTLDAKRTDSIPAVVTRAMPSEQGDGGGGRFGGDKRPVPYQLGVSVEFLYARLGTPLTPEHAQHQDALLTQQGLSPAERIEAHRQLEMTPLQRLKTPESPADEVTTAWARNLSLTDVRRFPVAAALRAVLSTSTLGRHHTVMPGMPVFDPLEHAYTEEFITFCPPRTTRVRIGQMVTTLKFDHYMSLLPVTRAPDNNTFMIMANATTIGTTAAAQLRATTSRVQADGDNMAATEAADDMIKFLTSPAQAILRDLDAIVCERSWRRLGSETAAWWVQAAQRACIPPDELPFHPTHLRAINRYLAKPGSISIPDGQDMGGLAESREYPSDDIYGVAQAAIKTARTLEQRKYEELVDAERFFRDPRSVSFYRTLPVPARPAPPPAAVVVPDQALGDEAVI